MQQTSSRFQMIRTRFSPSTLRTSLRRHSSASTATNASSCSSSLSSSSSSGSSSPISTINAVLVRQPSILGMEEEKRRSGVELSVLEPRPIVYWGGLEERILGSF
ncbi:hypothetical protein F5Y09DRAFT_316702 [Xylaria sp. FL1042]|nr:hypothetical protein F5Y09DRAFT_316702 [Xylaria sp. FL1042]